MMNKIQIIQVTLSHLDQLQKIARTTFSETFSDMNRDEDMAYYLEQKFSLRQLQLELETLHSFFYVAVICGKICGYLKVNLMDAQTELQDVNALEIERIYVLQQYHGQGVGQSLYVYALEMAQTKKLSYIWLGVWEHNDKAIQFYKKNGFVAFDQHIFQLGEDKQIDIMMKKKLSII